MFGLGFGEMLLLAAIALIAIGPKQLPEVARTLGKFLNEMKRATGDLTKNFSDVSDSTRSAFHETRKSMNETLTPVTSPYHSSQPYDGESLASQAADHVGVVHEQNPQGSLFVPTDLSHDKVSSTGNGLPKTADEEQLEFRLTSFGNESSDDKSGRSGKDS